MQRGLRRVDFPTPPDQFIDKLVAVGHRSRSIVSTLQPESDDWGLHTKLCENILRGMVTEQINLALVCPLEFEKWAKSAWIIYQEYQVFAAAESDPDLKQRCEELGWQLSRLLRDKSPGWTPPDVAVEELADESAET